MNFLFNFLLVSYIISLNVCLAVGSNGILIKSPYFTKDVKRLSQQSGSKSIYVCSLFGFGSSVASRDILVQLFNLTQNDVEVQKLDIANNDKDVLVVPCDEPGKLSEIGGGDMVVGYIHYSSLLGNSDDVIAYIHAAIENSFRHQEKKTFVFVLSCPSATDSFQMEGLLKNVIEDAWAKYPQFKSKDSMEVITNIIVINLKFL